MRYARQTLLLGQDNVAYIDQGQGPVLICLHAIGHSADDFADFIRASNGQFRCIAVDFPGHGASGQGSLPASAVYYADVVQALVDKLTISQFVIIGNSIGGATAITLAARLKERVQALVLCNPGGIFERSLLSQLAMPIFSSIFAQGEKRARWYKYFFKYYYRLVIRSSGAKWRRDEIVAQAYETARVCREAWQSFATPESDLRQTARSLEQPMLIAWAAQDKVNSLKLNLPTIRALKQAYLKTYPSGHIAFLECPAQFTRDFNEFISRISESAIYEPPNVIALQQRATLAAPG